MILRLRGTNEVVKLRRDKLVEFLVNEASICASGEIETLRAKLESLTEMVGTLAAAAPLSDTALFEALGGGGRGWEVDDLSKHS